MIGEVQKLTLSDRMIVEVAELDGYESQLADLILSSMINVDPEKVKAGDIPVMAMALLQATVYGVCSLRRIADQQVTPLSNVAEYARASRKLSQKEMRELQKWAQPLYSPEDAEVKKEPAPQP